MKFHPLQPGYKYSTPVALPYFPVLLLLLAVVSNTAIGQQSSFLVNQAINPLKSFVAASTTESHPFFVDIDGDGDLDCFAGEYTNGGGANFSKVYFFRNEGNKRNPLFKSVSGGANPLDK